MILRHKDTVADVNSWAEMHGSPNGRVYGSSNFVGHLTLQHITP